MIPVELEIRNFLSYREAAVLDLRQIHVACISGRNGAGKSSILEAMIWALFGKSRAPTEEDLVNRSARLAGEHMEVRLVFMLGDATYRIVRRRRKSDSLLEFALAGADGEWMTLTEGGKRDTQAVIEATLRMSYDTFVNASFLQQGQADAFTMQTPARRKEILADVLGVQVWELHRARFFARRRATENELLLLQGKMEDATAELAQRDVREAELAAALAAQAEVNGVLAARTALRDQARRTAEMRKAQLQQQKALTAQVERIAAQQAAQLAARDELAAQQAADLALLAGEAETTARYEQWRAADQARRRWEELFRDVTRLREAQAAAEREVAAAAGVLERQIATLEATETRLAARAGRGSRPARAADGAAGGAGGCGSAADLIRQCGPGAARGGARAAGAGKRTEKHRTRTAAGRGGRPAGGGQAAGAAAAADASRRAGGATWRAWAARCSSARPCCSGAMNSRGICRRWNRRSRG